MDGSNDPGAQGKTPARERLAAVIGELGKTSAELALAQAPATRLSAVIAEADAIEAERARLHEAEERQLGAWLAAGGGGRRPGPDPARTAVEARIATLAGDSAAARAALPAAEHAFRTCAERTRALQRQRDEAACLAAVEAARDFAVRYREALTLALEREAILQGLRGELMSAGNQLDGEPAALAAAAAVGALIAGARRDAGVRHNPQAGRRLLEALRTDADATL